MIRVLPSLEIGGDAVNRILALEENHFLDLKAREISGAKLVIHASAFANAAGGEIYVGIDEPSNQPRAWRGFTTIEDANGRIAALHDVFEGNSVLSLEFVTGVGVPGHLLHLIIEKSREIIRTTSDEIYTRVSAQKLPVKLSSHDEIVRLELDKGLASYEDMPLEGVSPMRVVDSLTVTRFMIEAVPVSESEPWLTSQQLLPEGRPTVGAILLFDDEPQVVLPKRSAIKVLRYKSSDTEGHRDQLDGVPSTFEGPLVDQISNSVDFVRETISEIPVQTSHGFEAVTYPTETLHEIITNAVLHRDYSIATDVQIRIFDNRVEVESPGKLPGHITAENVLSEQFARNGKIVRLINKFPNPPNKDVGEGLNTAFQKMRDLGLKAPSLEERDNHVLVTIRHERLASYEEQIVEYLLVEGTINNSMARTVTGEGSENTIKRVFEKMIESGQIYRDPERRGSATRYLLQPEFEKQRRSAR
jgi:ATP-dependent DNA helicase RecG